MKSVAQSLECIEEGRDEDGFDVGFKAGAGARAELGTEAGLRMGSGATATTGSGGESGVDSVTEARIGTETQEEPNAAAGRGTKGYKWGQRQGRGRAYETGLEMTPVV